MAPVKYKKVARGKNDVILASGSERILGIKPDMALNFHLFRSRNGNLDEFNNMSCSAISHCMKIFKKKTNKKV